MSDFIRKIKNPFWFRMYLIAKLPMAFLSGLKVITLTDEKCVVSIPFKYLTQNPFRSIYFACLSMAAEMSTGIICLTNIYNSNPPVSMLVVGLEGLFVKKATGKISFICNDGKKIREVVEQSKISREEKTVTVLSTGFNEAREKVAEFKITWSFKVKSTKK